MANKKPKKAPKPSKPLEPNPESLPVRRKRRKAPPPDWPWPPIERPKSDTG